LRAERLLLDMHIVLWLDGGDEYPRHETRRLIDQCRSGGTQVAPRA
jgi:hypothetical protein